MSLPVTFHAKTFTHGFTLVELLLVVSLMLIMSAFVFPLGFSFYQTQKLDETGSGIISALRRAQMFAVLGTHDDAFGVTFTEDAYVVFEGPSYLTRTVSQDEVFPLSTLVEIVGLQEVVFAPLSGEPDSSGSITVSSGLHTHTIQIHSNGMVE